MKKLVLIVLFFPVLAFASALDNLMPRPKQVLPAQEGEWVFDANAITHIDAPIPESAAEGAYKLVITPEGAEITAASDEGLRYAKVTLQQLATLSKRRLPCCTITDWPAFPIRGLLYDTGRNWQPIAQLKSQLSLLAAYKFNVFQWHITDNHGWRLQSKKYPELSRASNLMRSKRFYTQQEFRDLITTAHGMGITVIPELDVPGHTESFRKAFNLKRMDEPKVRQIITDLFDELTTLLDPKITPYIHIGSDEVKPHERVPGEWITGWIKQLEAKGFTVIAWGPGQHPPALDKPLVRQYWMGRQVKRDESEPYIDSQSSYYINHVDPLELLAAASFQKPCLTGTPDTQLGAIFAVWHDDAVAKPEDILTMNPVLPAIVLYSDNFWNGREADQMRYYANLPDPRDEAFKLPAELERRLLVHRDTFFTRGLPWNAEFGFPWFAYSKQTDLRWRMAETAEEKPFAELPWGERIIAQGTIYPQHFFFPQSNLTDGKSGCVWLGMVVESPRDQTVALVADFMNYSRSDGRSRDAALVQGKWNAKGAELYVNGKPVPPPRWKQPGISGGASREKPLEDEPWMVRPPLKVALKKGRNELLIKLPKKGWKWSATCFFPNDNGLIFSAPALPEAK